MDAEVYRNLQRRCYSVRTPHGRVFQHTDNAVLRDARFVVQAAGRARVQRERRKNVHALVRGEYVGAWAVDPASRDGHPDWVAVTYDPYGAPTFVAKATGAPIVGADLVWLNPRGCFAWHPRYAAPGGAA